MSTTLLMHIVAGSVGLVAGAVALYAVKGARLHRKIGMVFVGAMLLMSATGAVIAAQRGQTLSVIAGALTFYLVFTALLTIRRPAIGPRWIEFGAMLVALTIGTAGIYFGLEAVNSPNGEKAGFPAPAYFVFVSVALLAALLDVRMLARGVQGAHRLARHLWRMCFALFIATASLFLGQPQVFPEPLRKPALLAIPVLIVLLLMFFWLARVLFSKRFRRA